MMRPPSHPLPLGSASEQQMELVFFGSQFDAAGLKPADWSACLHK